MSTGFTIAIWAAAIVIVGARFVVPQLPLRRAIRLGDVDAILLGLGMLGLVFHCTSMFARPLLAWIPGISPLLDQINALGIVSGIWYVAPSVVVLIAVRRLPPPVLVAIVVVLAAVGLTMYTGASLGVHLATIFLLVVVLAGVSSALLVRRRPGRPARA